LIKTIATTLIQVALAIKQFENLVVTKDYVPINIEALWLLWPLNSSKETGFIS